MRPLSAVMALLVALGAACASTASSEPSTAASDGSSLRERMVEWHDDNGWVISMIITDTEEVSHNAGRGNLSLLANSCRDFGRTIDIARSMPPIPDPGVNRPWAQALTDYANAATACVEGTTTYSVPIIELAVDYMRSGNDHMAEAADALEDLGA